MSNIESERRLLAEIAGIADRVRALRAGGVFHDGAQIKALEGQSRLKWDELRALRAGPVNMEPLPTPSNRSPHR
ncbi:MAG TPA: hypothetical protein VJP07_03365 [Dehalococcoidia bacterium]|nr:hypothetical protein [Dehalococcoidia bacterium]